MILSFSKRFIFIKPIKMASSSVEEALSRFCDPAQDIVSPDSHRPDGWNHIRGEDRFFNHMRYHQILATGIISMEEFKKDFHKITICRNPWDHQVSSFWHQAYLDKRYDGKTKQEIETVYRQDFTDFIVRICQQGKEGQKQLSKDFYFYSNNSPYFDTCLRFENLQHGFNQLCDILQEKPTRLPRLKTHTRVLPYHYRTYYTDHTKQLVGDCYQQMADFFGYTFD